MGIAVPHTPLMNTNTNIFGPPPPLSLEVHSTSNEKYSQEQQNLHNEEGKQCGSTNQHSWNDIGGPLTGITTQGLIAGGATALTRRGGN